MPGKKRKIKVQFKGNIKIPMQPITAQVLAKPLEKYVRKKHLKKGIMDFQPDGFYVRGRFGIILLKKKIFKSTTIDYCRVCESDPKSLVVVDNVNNELSISLIRFESAIEIKEVFDYIQELQGNNGPKNDDNAPETPRNDSEDGADIYNDIDRVDGPVDDDLTIEIDNDPDTVMDVYSANPAYNDMDSFADMNQNPLYDDSHRDDNTDNTAVVEEVIDMDYYFHEEVQPQESLRKRRNYNFQSSLPNLHTDFDDDFDVESHKAYCGTAKIDNISRANLDKLCDNEDDWDDRRDTPRKVGVGSVYMFSKHHTLSMHELFGQCESDDED